MFGILSSPFLLNTAIDHHMGTYCDSDPALLDKFCSSIYVVLESTNVESIYQLYLKSTLQLAEAGFKLRKIITKFRWTSTSYSEESVDGGAGENSISVDDVGTKEPFHIKEDQSYSKSSLATKEEKKPETHKVLGGCS